MPPGTPRRTGADEATTITTDKPLKPGTLSLAPGIYTINTEPGDKGWQLIIGKLGKPGRGAFLTMPRSRPPRADDRDEDEGAGRAADTYVDDTPTGGTLRVEWGGVKRARAVHGRLAPSVFAPAVRRSPPVQR